MVIQKLRGRTIAIRNEVGEFRRILRENYTTLIISSFGLVAALAWNEAIKELISTVVPLQGHLSAKLYSAIIITTISVIATYLLSKLRNR